MNERMGNLRRRCSTYDSFELWNFLLYCTRMVLDGPIGGWNWNYRDTQTTATNSLLALMAFFNAIAHWMFYSLRSLFLNRSILFIIEFKHSSKFYEIIHHILQSSFLSSHVQKTDHFHSSLFSCSMIFLDGWRSENRSFWFLSDVCIE